MTVVRADLAEFQQRSREWVESTGMVQGAGRRDDLIGAAYGALGNKTGTSIFSPTLAEICYRWWCPRPQTDGRPVIVLDTSCGDVTRGCVAAHLNLWYIGVDTSADQIAANEAQLATCCAGVAHVPTYVLGDGEDCVAIVREACVAKGLDADTPVDFVFSCPPYWNLECYDAAPHLRAADMSGLPSWDAFCRKMDRVIRNATGMLRYAHAACFVTGNLRDDHELLDMGSATKSSLDKAGCKLLNSGVYATPLVSAPLRAGRTMAAGAKLCSAHQEILCATKETVLTPALARTYNIRPNLEE